MRRFCIFFALVAMVWSAGVNQPAHAQAFSGTTGTNSVGATGPAPQIPAAVPAVPQVLPPVFQGSANAQPQAATLPPALPASPAVPVVPTAQTTPAYQPNTAVPPVAGQLDASTLPTDPCAAYLNSYDVYAVCQDRVKRLTRMQEVKAKREAEVVARRKAIEDRKKAEAEAKALRASQPKMRRPGQVAPPPKAPQQVEIVPSEEKKK